ncbi:MAG TPA: phosphatase PAP2 family protein [Blastocatellia bacterium]|nr:phosphatase PAP2 family protein [Blastocatellia bacterium]
MMEIDRTTNFVLTAPRSWSSVLSYFNLTDRLTLAYLAFVGLLLALSPNPLEKRGKLLAAHIGFAVMICALAYFRQRQTPFLHFLSYWYPLGLSGFFFEEIHSIVHIIHRGWFDAGLIQFDYAMFGAHPTVWFEQHISFWLTEVMNFFYFTYWPLVPALAALLWLRNQKQFVEFVFAMCLSYIFCYLVFIFYPIEGPYHTLRSLQTVHEMPGWIFTHLVEFVEKHGRIHGGAFPSAHVAGSFVATMAAYRFSRRLGHFVLILALGVCVSAVYGRYHYVVDIWGGMAAAGLGFWITRKIFQRQALP